MNSAKPTSGESAPSPPVPDAEALLVAFDSSIDDLEAELEAEVEAELSPAEKRRRAHQLRQEEARQAHLRRLEILSALPLELSVEPVKNKCPGCGSVLQSVSADRPGFLPQEIFAQQAVDTAFPNVEETVEKDIVEKAPSEPVCQRCYRLTHYGAIEPHLRVITKGVKLPSKKQETSVILPPSNDLTPEKFRRVLERLQSTNAVIIYLVDIFDFHGTFISSLKDIIGWKNPIMLAVNKVDLLPQDYKASRVEAWITHECAAMGLRQVEAVHLISSTKGTGVNLLLADAVRTAKKRRADIYVIGAANVGKSSFINQLIRLRKKEKRKPSDRDGPKRSKQQLRKADIGALTTSVVPGTTLDVIRISLGRNISLFDTPGLMMPHQLTNFLDAKDLRAVLPSKTVEKVTLRLGEGKALYIGALARIEIVAGRPFFFTSFFSPQVKIHPGRSEDAEQFLEHHAGEMLTPPFSKENFSLLGEWTSKSFTANGEGWRKSCLDIVLSGLGWVAVTGVGDIRLRVCVPKGVGVFTREPLMPFETQTGASSYTGSSTVNRRQIKKATKRRKRARARETFE